MRKVLKLQRQASPTRGIWRGAKKVTTATAGVGNSNLFPRAKSFQWSKFISDSRKMPLF
jgi:hypothetical protein